MLLTIDDTTIPTKEGAAVATEACRTSGVRVPRSIADALLEKIMTTILIVVVLLMLFGGGGYYGYRRRW